MRNASLRRVLTLWRRLDGLTYAPHIEVLAREFGVSQRTIRRDLLLLEEVGFILPLWRYESRAA